MNELNRVKTSSLQEQDFFTPSKVKGSMMGADASQMLVTVLRML